MVVKFDLDSIYAIIEPSIQIRKITDHGKAKAFDEWMNSVRKGAKLSEKDDSIIDINDVTKAANYVENLDDPYITVAGILILVIVSYQFNTQIKERMRLQQILI